VGEVADLLRSELIDAKVVVRTNLEPALGRVRAPRVELQQVLMNLLMNAIQAMNGTPAGRRFIDVETQNRDKVVQLCIRDAGKGIAPDKLAVVFDPFYSTKKEGLGMGLSICRRLIENHGGQIGVRSHPEGGVTFWFMLPMVNPPLDLPPA
jgi:signal transduction histidine kinase